MKKRSVVFIVVLVLLLVSLACSSSDNELLNAVSDFADSSERLMDAANEALGNEEDTADKPTRTPEVGSTRGNPFPAGSKVVADDMEFEIIEAIRPADRIILNANMFNEEPDSDQEYVLLDLQVTCLKPPDDECSFSPMYDIEMTGSSGITYDAEWWTSGVDRLLEPVDFYGGGTVSGVIPFIVNISDTNLILAYDAFLSRDTFYLSVPQVESGE